MTFSCLGFWYFDNLADNMDFIHDYWEAVSTVFINSEAHLLEFAPRGGELP